jgi:error-prone DNA polymerase
LRRSMAAWRRRGGLEHFRARLVRGMQERGYDTDFAERIYQQILGFGEYGFPESHAASFALLVYVSAWMKRHHPACFTCALLNSQPMGFYAPSQLVQDVARHGVEVRPVDVNASDWDSTLEPGRDGPALRLGLRLVNHLGEDGAKRLTAAREEGKFRDAGDLAERGGLDRGELNALAAAGALDGISRHRYRAAWDLGGTVTDRPLLAGAWPKEPEPMLRPPRIGETVQADYAALGLSLGPHPLSLLRDTLDRRRIRTADRIAGTPHGTRVRVAGIVTCRQRPSSANNVVFVTLEDETGYVNLVVWKHVAERDRRALLSAQLMAAWGELQREGEVIHIIARQLRDMTPLLGELPTRSRDFR